MKDEIYDDLEPAVGTFRFDERVAGVFTDMIARSVPGYRETVWTAAELAKTIVPDDGLVFDLGASLGSVSLAVAAALSQRQPGRIVAVDSAPAMLARWRRQATDAAWPIEQRCEDLRETAIHGAHLVVLNYTLQFLAKADRREVLQRVADGLQEGGVLLLSEKVCDEDQEVDAAFVRLHHAFKRDRGYSELAISRKRDALEGVLIPETVGAHEQRLLDVGFRRVRAWQRCWNFMSWIAWR